MVRSSRRQFLISASCSASAALLSAPIRAVAMHAYSADDAPIASPARLDSGWEFGKGPIGSIAQVWNPETVGSWKTVTLPHCFNGHDACDPDKPYFRGQGWYRARISFSNPFVEGRTVLHFQGAGQTTTLWVGSTLIGTHKGGYDEFAFDITDAVKQLPHADNVEGVPVIVLCDNSPDIERVPSDLSDFCLYGGL